jgi:hypothetical protein
LPSLKIKFDRINEWYIVNLPNLFKYFPILFNTLSCLEAFLQIFVMWELNFNS